MNYTCRMNLSTITDENGNICNTYGLDMLKNNRTVISIPDISTDKTKTKKLVELINHEKLSIIHIYDVIEDFL